MADERITTEDLAIKLGATPQAIYESRRRNEYPGRLGHRNGRRLIFHRSEINDWLESVPEEIKDDTGVVTRWETDPAYGEGETVNDATQAILWALGGIHTTLRAIHNELRAQRPTADERWRQARGAVVNTSGLTAAELIREVRDADFGCCSPYPWSQHYDPATTTSTGDEEE